MPQVAEDLAEDLVFQFLDADDWLLELQLRAYQNRKYLAGGAASRLRLPERAVRIRMAQLERSTIEYYRYQVPRIYMKGVKQVVEEGSYELSTKELRQLQEIIAQGENDITRASAYTQRDTHRYLAEVRKKENSLDGFPKRDVIGDPPGIIRNRGIESIRYADGKQYKLADWAGMSLRSNANRTYNLGILNAADRFKIMLEVQDGPECGWTKHDDGDQANGKIVSPQEAMAYPTAHPNCKRTFLPRRDLKFKPKREPVRKAAEAVAAVAGVTAASTAAVALARNTQLRDLLISSGITLLRGDPLVAYFTQRLNSVRSVFTRGVEEAEVIPGQFPNTVRRILSGGPEPPDLIPGSPPWRLAVGDVLRHADRFAHGVQEVPEWVRHAIGGATTSTRRELEQRFRLFAKYVRKVETNELAKESAQGLANVLQFEATHRNLTRFSILKDSLSTGIRGTWSRYGPRMRVDLTEWVRGKATLTPSGVIQSLTVNPARRVRTQIRMFQDGRLGGHVSLIPKGPLRAIIEVDEYGKLVGNIRVVPKGPLKIKLEFRLKGWNARAFGDSDEAISFREGLVASVERASARLEIAKNRLRTAERLNISPNDIARARQAVDEAQAFYERRFGQLRDIMGFEFNIENPRARALIKDFRQLELYRAIVEYRLPRIGPLQLSGDLKIPLKEVTEWLRHPINNTGELIRNTDGTLSGIFRYVADPRKILGGIKSFAQNNTVMGELRFSVFHLPTKIRTRLNFENLHLQAIATKLQIRGYNVFDIANVMEMTAIDVIELATRQTQRLGNFMRHLGVVRVEDIRPLWQTRLATARTRFQDARNKNDAEIIRAAVDRMQGKRTSPGPTGILKTLAGIKDTDTPEIMERKLISLREYLKVEMVDRADILDELNSVSRFELRAIARGFVPERSRAIRLRGEAGAVGLPTGQPYNEVFLDVEFAGAKTFDELEKIVDVKGYQTWKYRDHEIEIRGDDIDFDFGGPSDPRLYEAALEDVTKVIDFIESRYKGLTINEWDRKVRFSFGRAELGDLEDGVIAEYAFDDHTITINWEAGVAWDTTAAKIIEDVVKSRHWAITAMKGTQHVLLHEYGHALSDAIFSASHIKKNLRSGNILYRNLAKHFGIQVKEIPTDFNAEVPYAIFKQATLQISEYAGTSMGELIAEALAQYWGLLEPSELARIVGEWIDDFYK